MSRIQRRAIVRQLLAIILVGLSLNVARANDRPPTPEPDDLIALIRNTILAVDVGNKSGDYTNLHNAGTAEFKAAHPVAQLSDEFKSLRDSSLDMALAAEKTPLLTGPPQLDVNGLLRMLGGFKFPDSELIFDLLYRYDVAAKIWQLAGITLNPRVLPPPPEIMQPE